MKNGIFTNFWFMGSWNWFMIHESLTPNSYSDICKIYMAVLVLCVIVAVCLSADGVKNWACYLHSAGDGVVWPWHFLVNLCIYICVYIYTIYIYTIYIYTIYMYHIYIYIYHIYIYTIYIHGFMQPNFATTTFNIGLS